MTPHPPEPCKVNPLFLNLSRKVESPWKTLLTVVSTFLAGGRVALGGVGGLFILPPNNDQEMEACYKMQRGSCSPGRRTGGRTVALAAAGTVARSLVPHLSWDAQATAGEAGGWSRARARRDPRSTSRRRSVESPILDHSFYKGSVPRFRPRVTNSDRVSSVSGSSSHRPLKIRIA